MVASLQQHFCFKTQITGTPTCCKFTTDLKPKCLCSTQFLCPRMVIFKMLLNVPKTFTLWKYTICLEQNTKSKFQNENMVAGPRHFCFKTQLPGTATCHKFVTDLKPKHLYSPQLLYPKMVIFKTFLNVLGHDSHNIACEPHYVLMI